MRAASGAVCPLPVHTTRGLSWSTTSVSNGGVSRQAERGHAALPHGDLDSDPQRGGRRDAPEVVEVAFEFLVPAVARQAW